MLKINRENFRKRGTVMKKILSILLSISLIVVGSSVVAAQAEEANSPFDKMPISVISNDSLATISASEYINSTNVSDKITLVEKSNYTDDLLNKLKADFENSKIIVFYNNNNDLLDPLYALNTLGYGNGMAVSYEDDDARENANHIIASAAYIDENNNIHSMAYFDLSNTDSSIRTKVLNIAETYLDYDDRVGERYSTNIVAPLEQTRASNPYDDYTNVIKEFTFDWGKYGKMQSTSCFSRVGYTSSQSVWDLYGANFFQVKSPYGAQEVFTRYSVEDIANERVVDHGPTTISSGGTATVGLDTGGPSISWSQDLSGIYLNDYYNPPDYARWKFTYTIAQSDKNMTFNPGARFTNTSGQFLCDVSHSYRCIKAGFLGIGREDKTFSTGTYRYYMNDR